MRASLAALLVFLLGAAASAEEARVAFDVRLPPGTPAETIYVAGNQPGVGDWNAAGLPLERTGPSSARGSVALAEGTLFEFKITRGSWATVEKGVNFGERPNRALLVSGDTTLVVVVETWADSAPPAPPTRSGDIRVHDRFASGLLSNERTILVYLPPGYDDTDARYGVLYMHDGQNLFDASTSFLGIEWGVDEACERLIAAGEIPPLIVVGIYNNDDRVGEYTPVANERGGLREGGRGETYARFLIEELKPFVDGTYRTRPDREHTAVAGSSLGGLISLDLAWRRPDIFGSIGVVSPALWWGDSEIVRRIEASPPPEPRPRLWIDMGTREGDSLEDFRDAVETVRRLARILEEKGFRRGADFRAEEYEGAVHNEGAWAARTPEILRFFYR